ncbi:allantoinase PuuE [Bradyrhizobium sp. U87765 SZCCT0131]|uniref:allantoinase PuuE n=1 Tax=unclassified Bradyrhizobium TaxID=2631580 RepID=UPI001BAA1391|nr:MULTISPECIES: allantoinase PuuE [unclassified Bradyrhizobium]MBR1218269.1 allantoinase PuuE [Bradyrhizobium sp. U87765 SZCCT0131]MBR1260785.1 allantoinase PuuE [Bradyrhizobium sp. U87765 SZCCT0134]MBR1303767.1 allantoinase PuuE [Bradyrhizobium sp. U87765 SZCCT0110]MBR1319373.1 allantoinase PuuE [Bradyrhizobium sp. U87765 SZCCT0109]MBR1347698.1 allantoinase PuuE [Bradyrhizobium sp. U87765 SZCCT0048]
MPKTSERTSAPIGAHRDMIGYGDTPPDPQWPGDAYLALQIVLNYEEGGENSPLYGDATSESYLSELVGIAPYVGKRNLNIESLYEYGSRAGFWRLRRLMVERGMPLTVFGVATALAANPTAVKAMVDAGWDIASHGLRWIDYKDFDPAEEEAHVRAALDLHEQTTGSRPLGWYTGRLSEQTLDIVMDHGDLLYSSDSYCDDLPYWVHRRDRRHLIVPYSLDTNDMRFVSPQGFNAGDQFLSYLRDTFDVLYDEGRKGQPKMMSVGLHCRIAGRPGRTAALARFLDHVAERPRVWITTRADIARHWHAHHAREGVTG